MVLLNRLQQVFSGDISTTSVSSGSEWDEVSSTDRKKSNHNKLLNRVNLPWNKTVWNINITNAITPNEVWGRLRKNEDLGEAEQIHCTKLPSIAGDVITIGHIYIYKSNHEIHRVKVISSFMQQNCIYFRCFFIDSGHQKTIARGNLFYCTQQYAQLPQQAICFELNGYDELADLPCIEQYFGAKLNGKYLVASVTTTQEQYRMQQMDDDCELPKIKISLFGWLPKFSLLKPILLKEICDLLPPPKFGETITSAKMSHISNTGIVYFHIDPIGLSYINAKIHQISRDDDRLMPYVSHCEAVKSIALAYDNTTSTYFRVQILSCESTASYTCFCTDYGDIKSIKITNLFTFCDESVLSYYPSQAVPAILNGIHAIDDIVRHRLQSILNGNAKILVKAVEHKHMGALPIVSIFKRSPSNGRLFNVNKFICMEIELRSFAAMLPIDPLW